MVNKLLEAGNGMVFYQGLGEEVGAGKIPERCTKDTELQLNKSSGDPVCKVVTTVVNNK